MIPSPPPPPPGQFPVDTPRHQGRTRHAQREERRAAKMARRQQETLLRQQLRGLRRRSILGPIMLVSLGLLFLLLEMGTVQPLSMLHLLATWWPAVLIGAGLILLAEWAADTWVAAQHGAALPRRTVGAGTSLFLILLTVAGIGEVGINHGAGWLQDHWQPALVNSTGLEDVFAQHSQNDQDLTAPLAAGGLLTIRNYRGDVTVTGSSTDGLVHVTAHQRLVAWGRQDLRARKRKDLVRLVPSGSGLLLQAAGNGKDRTDFTIEVPRQTGIVLDSETGQVSVNELQGPVTIRDHVGSVALTALTGSVHLNSNDDDATITGHSLNGPIDVEGRSGDLQFSDVTGSLTLHGDFFGATRLQRISGPVHFQSSFTDLHCAALSGEITVDGRSVLEGHSIQGPLVVTTTDRNLVFTDVSHGASISNGNGSVSMVLADVLSPVTVNTTDGSIDVRVPKSASFAVAATTSDGHIRSDLGLASENNEDTAVLKRDVGHGGPMLSLRTTDGDITLHTKAGKPPEMGNADDDGDADGASDAAGHTRRL